VHEVKPSPLELLRFARRVIVQQATAAPAQIGGWISAEERREAERRRGEEMRLRRRSGCRSSKI
jgi:hypothetical protein